jgi:hypothetical protein
MIPTAEEIADEIRMRCIASSGPFLLVEGPSDVTFFSQHTTIRIENILPSFGCENLIEAITTLEDKDREKVIGVIDLDYRGTADTSSIPDNVFTTDSHDLETMMFSSPAFQKVLRQKSSTEKVKSYPNGSNGIKGKILKLGQPIGCIRFYSQLKGKQYSFENLDYEKFIDRKWLSFSDKKFISHLRGIHPNNGSIPGDILKHSRTEAKKTSVLSDSLRLCCGHDIMEIMAIGLKSMWGSHSGTQISGDLLEELFMLAYSHQMFCPSYLFQKMSKWFHDRAYNSPWCE